MRSLALVSLLCLIVAARAQSAASDTEANGWDVLSAGSWNTLVPAYTLAGGVTVETDFPVGSFSAFLQSSAMSNVTGNSRLNVTFTTLLYNGRTLPSNGVLVAHIHAGPCSGSPPGGGHYLQNTSLADDTLPVPPPAGQGQGSNPFSLRIPSTGFASASQPFLVDYDRALSVVLHEGAAVSGYAPKSPGSRIGCADLTPTLPDLPHSYSMTIEANFGLTKQYTLVRQQYQSAAWNKVTAVEHSNMMRVAVVQDFNTNMTYTVQQNTTYPNGVCVPTSCRNTPLSQCGTTVPDLNVFFNLGDGQPISFEGVNLANVRGISCERWTRNFSFTSPMGSSNGTARYYVPVSSWKNRGEQYHRLLKRIEVFGTSAGRGGSYGYSHSYEFVNFVPAVINPDVFDPCRVLNMGPLGVQYNVTITGCGCDALATAVPPSPSPSSSGGNAGLAGRIIIPLLTLVVGAGGGLFVGRMHAGSNAGNSRKARDEEGVALTSSAAA